EVWSSGLITNSDTCRFYDRDVSAALSIRRCAVGPGPRPTELCYWTNRPAVPKPGQDWLYCKMSVETALLDALTEKPSQHLFNITSTQGSPSYHSEAGRRLNANLKWKGHVLPMLFSSDSPVGPGASHRGNAGRGGSRTAPGAAVGLSPPARKRYAAALLSELDQERAEQAQYFQSQRATLTSAHVFTWGGRFKFNSPAQPSAAGANLAARWTPGRQRVPLRLDSRSDA
ncbi:hypothetical protein QJQ45_013797, partial [Haematococcus lacustris]